MTTGLQMVVRTREGAHQGAITLYEHAQTLLAARKGAEVELIVRECEDDRTSRANRFYWGVVLKTIAGHCFVNGERYSADAWHELFKREFLGYSVKRIQVAGRKKKQVIRRLRSTSDLKVRAFSQYLEKIMAYAATELGLEWHPANHIPSVLAGHTRGVVIDADTGEITEAPWM